MTDAALMTGKNVNPDIHTPANTTFEQAAVVAVSATVALQAVDAGRVRPGQNVLVTGVCSTTKLDLVRSLGADHVIDYTKDDFADSAHHYDLILDIAGNPSLSRLRRALTSTGQPSSSAVRKAAGGREA